MTISPEVGASPAAETLRVRAALYGFAAPAKIQQAILSHICRRLRLADNRIAELADASRESMTQNRVRAVG